MKLTKNNLKSILDQINDNKFIDVIYDGLKKGLYLGIAHKSRKTFYELKATSMIDLTDDNFEYTLNELNISGLYKINFVKKEITNLSNDIITTFD